MTFQAEGTRKQAGVAIVISDKAMIQDRINEERHILNIGILSFINSTGQDVC